MASHHLYHGRLCRPDSTPLDEVLEQLRILGQRLSAPVLTGQTPEREREELFRQFRSGELRVLIVSKVANFAIAAHRSGHGEPFGDFAERFVKAVSVTTYVIGLGKAPVFAAIKAAEAGVRSATPAELAGVPGISSALAARIHQFLIENP